MYLHTCTLLDPIQVIGNFSVNARVAILGATNPKTDNTHQIYL